MTRVACTRFAIAATGTGGGRPVRPALPVLAAHTGGVRPGPLVARTACARGNIAATGTGGGRRVRPALPVLLLTPEVFDPAHWWPALLLPNSLSPRQAWVEDVPSDLLCRCWLLTAEVFDPGLSLPIRIHHRQSRINDYLLLAAP